jgi:hypothetical protein
MKTILTSVLAFGAMTSVALATVPATPSKSPTGPVALTDAQLDTVTAGAIVGGAVNAQVLLNQNFQAVNNQCQGLIFLIC